MRSAPRSTRLRAAALAHNYTAESISRAVGCGVRPIEHGNLIDRVAAEVVGDQTAFVVPTLVTYGANHRFAIFVEQIFRP